jgi:SET domain-containing protein
VKPYLFQLVLGPDAMSTFVVYPKDYASVGFFMNHANSKCKKSKINVKTSIAIAETGPIILMQSTRKITYGEELLYDYNGAFESYNTSAFE